MLAALRVSAIRLLKKPPDTFVTVGEVLTNLRAGALLALDSLSIATEPRQDTALGVYASDLAYAATDLPSFSLLFEHVGR